VFCGGEDVETGIAVSPYALDWALAFEQQANALACEYWQARRNGRLMPARADLDPVAMRKFSAHVGLIELRGPGNETDYFIRRSGSRLDEVYGPITGRSLRDFLPPRLLAVWHEMIGAVCRQLAPARIATRADFEGKTWLNVEMLLAPLGEDGKVNMIFLCFVAWPKETP
jgi:hypothetical protein